MWHVVAPLQRGNVAVSKTTLVAMLDLANLHAFTLYELHKRWVIETTETTTVPLRRHYLTVPEPIPSVKSPVLSEGLNVIHPACPPEKKSRCQKTKEEAPETTQRTIRKSMSHLRMAEGLRLQILAGCSTMHFFQSSIIYVFFLDFGFRFLFSLGDKQFYSVLPKTFQISKTKLPFCISKNGVDLNFLLPLFFVFS